MLTAHFTMLRVDVKMNRVATEIDLPKILTVPELASYLGVPVSTVRYWREQGRGPRGFRVGKRLYFSAEAVTDWLEDQKQDGGSR
jgi:excisionase family DNA binding protein